MKGKPSSSSFPVHPFICATAMELLSCTRRIFESFFSHMSCAILRSLFGANNPTQAVSAPEPNADFLCPVVCRVAVPIQDPQGE